MKVLVTCPAMLRQIARFSMEFERLGWKISAPEIVQTISEDQLMEIVPNHDGWIIGDEPVTAAVLEAGTAGAGRLRAAVRWGIGVDNVDFEAAGRFGIPISNTPDVFGKEVADLALHYLTGLARRSFEIDRRVREGDWPKPCGISLAGKRMALVGYGDVGKNIAKRATAADIYLTVYDPAMKDVELIAPHEFRRWPAGLEECDFVMLACSLTQSSRHLINRRSLRILPSHALLVNVARGGLVDEVALIEALSTGQINAVALDVFEAEPPAADSPLLSHPKCVFGSHNASNTVEAVDRASLQAITILAKSLKHL